MLHLEQNYNDPQRRPAPLLEYTCKGVKCTCTQASKPRQCESITIPILHKLKAQLQAHPTFNRFDKRLLWAAFTLAFYGFLRGREMMSPSVHNFNPLCDLTMGDVLVNPDRLTFTIKQSNSFGKQYRAPFQQPGHQPAQFVP